MSSPGILSKNAQTTLKVKVNDPHSQDHPGKSQDVYSGKFGDFSSKPLRVIVRKIEKFPRLLSKNGQNDQEDKGQ